MHTLEMGFHSRSRSLDILEELKIDIVKKLGSSSLTSTSAARNIDGYAVVVALHSLGIGIVREGQHSLAEVVK